MGRMEIYSLKRMMTPLRGIVMLLVGLIASAVPMYAQAYGKDIFEELADMPSVESTYVSERFAHHYKQWNMSGRSLDTSMGFSSLFAYDLTSAKSVTKAKQLLEDYMKTHPKLEVMMRTRSGMSDYMVLEEFGADGKLYKWIIWDYRSPNGCEIVVVNWKDGYDKKTDQ